MTMLNMMLGEVAPGGVGSGLYGILIIAVIAVFVAGLMVGRTPEYLGKKIGAREIKLASLYILTTPTLVLLGTGLSFAIPAVRADVEKVSIWNPGPHGFSRGALRLHLGREQQRLGVRRTHREHPVAEHRARRRDVPRPLRADRVRARARRLARRAGQGARHRRHAAHAPTAVRRASSSARSSSSPHSPTSPFSRWVPWQKGCTNPCPHSQTPLHQAVARPARRRRRAHSVAGS